MMVWCVHPEPFVLDRIARQYRCGQCHYPLVSQVFMMDCTGKLPTIWWRRFIYSFHTVAADIQF